MHLIKRTNNTTVQRDNKGLIIGLTVGLLLVSGILLGIILYRRNRRNKLGKEPKDISVKEEFVDQVKTAYKVTDAIYQFLKTKEDNKPTNNQNNPTNKIHAEMLVNNDNLQPIEPAYLIPAMDINPIQSLYPNTVNEVVSISTANKLNDSSPAIIDTALIAQETQSGSEQFTTPTQDFTSNIEFPIPKKLNVSSNNQEKTNENGTLAQDLFNNLSSGLGEKININSVNKLFKTSKLKANNFMNNQTQKN